MTDARRSADGLRVRWGAGPAEQAADIPGVVLT
ncbi:hypothetical protein FB558_2439 [Pseudonocardia kunmingensis]|uniref:Uncharacterized protein n=1 Tax=Pseudonocardia kunmingensis TaxID=630975 RepID=A0A543E2G8_9PSEU|nr:hypothetical protein FB558_2439 [Pseudonocardia kunmingensis]